MVFFGHIEMSMNLNHNRKQGNPKMYPFCHHMWLKPCHQLLFISSHGKQLVVRPCASAGQHHGASASEHGRFEGMDRTLRGPHQSVELVQPMLQKLRRRPSHG